VIDLEPRLLQIAGALGGPLFGLDTSGRTASLSFVAWGDRRARELQLPAAVQPSESVAASIALELDRASMKAADLRAIVVGIGPGSFTGLRVGLALAKGLAVGGGVPLYGVSSLATLAAAHGPGRVALALDARRGDAFTALYDIDDVGLAHAVIEDAARPPQLFAARLRDERPARLVLGDAAGLLGVEGVPVEPSAEARAGFAILQAEARLRSGQSDDVATLVPRYLRVSEAERQAGDGP
jgi:tRNA threonylcarbamoyladenosine biosynthesis protein TsaB